MKKYFEMNYLILSIISDLIHIYEEENSYCEGSLTETKLLEIIDKLNKIKEL